MDDPPENQPDTGEETMPESDVDARFREVKGFISGVNATTDQLAAAQGRTLEGLAALAFALGVLAAIVCLQQRQIKALADAFPR